MCRRGSSGSAGGRVTSAARRAFRVAFPEYEQAPASRRRRRTASTGMCPRTGLCTSGSITAHTPSPAAAHRSDPAAGEPRFHVPGQGRECEREAEGGRAPTVEQQNATHRPCRTPGGSLPPSSGPTATDVPRLRRSRPECLAPLGPSYICCSRAMAWGASSPAEKPRSTRPMIMYGGVRGDPTEDRGGREQRQADQEHPPAAVHVAQPAGRDEGQPNRACNRR